MIACIVESIILNDFWKLINEKLFIVYRKNDRNFEQQIMLLNRGSVF